MVTSQLANITRRKPILMYKQLRIIPTCIIVIYNQKVNRCTHAEHASTFSNRRKKILYETLIISHFTGLL